MWCSRVMTSGVRLPGFESQDENLGNVWPWEVSWGALHLGPPTEEEQGLHPCRGFVVRTWGNMPSAYNGAQDIVSAVIIKWFRKL